MKGGIGVFVRALIYIQSVHPNLSLLRVDVVGLMMIAEEILVLVRQHRGVIQGVAITSELVREEAEQIRHVSADVRVVVGLIFLEIKLEIRQVADQLQLPRVKLLNFTGRQVIQKVSLWSEQVYLIMSVD